MTHFQGHPLLLFCKGNFQVFNLSVYVRHETRSNLTQKSLFFGNATIFLLVRSDQRENLFCYFLKIEIGRKNWNVCKNWKINELENCQCFKTMLISISSPRKRFSIFLSAWISDYYCQGRKKTFGIRVNHELAQYRYSRRGQITRSIETWEQKLWEALSSTTYHKVTSSTLAC